MIFSAFGPTLAILLLILFAGYAVFGSSGILAWGDYSKRLKDAKAELAVAKAEHDRLKNKVDLLNPRRADPDLVDELIRKDLNVNHPDEVIVPLKQ